MSEKKAAMRRQMKPIKLNYLSFFSMKICLIRTHNCIWNNQTKKYDRLDIRCYCYRRRHCGGTPSKSATLFSRFRSRAHAIIFFIYKCPFLCYCVFKSEMTQSWSTEITINCNIDVICWMIIQFIFTVWITMSRDLTCCSIKLSARITILIQLLGWKNPCDEIESIIITHNK